MLYVCWVEVAAMALKGALVTLRAPFSTAYLGRDWTMRESKTANFSISADIGSYNCSPEIIFDEQHYL
jgi:hypothetical protein